MAAQVADGGQQRGVVQIGDQLGHLRAVGQPPAQFGCIAAQQPLVLGVGHLHDAGAQVLSPAE